MTDQMNLLDWQPAPARNSDPVTSHLAADRAGMKASHNRLMVLRHLIAGGPMTDFELAEACGIQQTSIGKGVANAGTGRLSRSRSTVARPSPASRHLARRPLFGR